MNNEFSTITYWATATLAYIVVAASITIAFAGWIAGY